MLGTTAHSVPVLPEARVLLAAAVQRITTDVAGTASVALTICSRGLESSAQPMALSAMLSINSFMTRAAYCVSALLPPKRFVDRACHAPGSACCNSRFGCAHCACAWRERGQWTLRLACRYRFSPTRLWATAVWYEPPSPTTGDLNAIINLHPFNVLLQWHQPGGATDIAALWPNPAGASLARMLAKSAPSLGGHVALELMRRADDTARPIIDAVLDALGLLGGVASDADRAIRPLASLSPTQRDGCVAPTRWQQAPRRFRISLMQFDPCSVWLVHQDHPSHLPTASR